MRDGHGRARGGRKEPPVMLTVTFLPAHADCRGWCLQLGLAWGAGVPTCPECDVIMSAAYGAFRNGNTVTLYAVYGNPLQFGAETHVGG